jgi:hypothetical protein
MTSFPQFQKISSLRVNLTAFLAVSEFGVRRQACALEHRDMSRCGKAATRRRTPNQSTAAFLGELLRLGLHLLAEKYFYDTEKLADLSDFFLVGMDSILPRIGQTAGKVEARDVSFSANARNQHHHARVALLKIEEQHDASVHLRIAMDEPVRTQM